jgi:hypothetical protein
MSFGRKVSLEPKDRRKKEVVKMITSMTERKGMEVGIRMPRRSCVHMEDGRAGIPRICIHDYECSHCAFDQWIEEMERRALSVPDYSIEKDLLAEAV